MLQSGMAKKSYPLSKVYGLLEPGPVLLLSTAHRGQTNIMTMSWHTMLEFEPPLVGCVVSNRNHSFKLLKASKECVLNIPDVSLADKVVAVGNSSGLEIDKFAAFGLTPVPSSKVQAPRVDECFAQLECRVADTRMVNTYNLFVLEVVKAWIDPARKDARTIHHRGWGTFMVAGETLTLPSATP
jgi:flavin reductase (DIM6/NTAB) family NADH-FMN oxidoreductase RutF